MAPALVGTIVGAVMTLIGILVGLLLLGQIVKIETKILDAVPDTVIYGLIAVLFAIAAGLLPI